MRIQIISELVVGFDKQDMISQEKQAWKALTDGIFEFGAYGVPSESQNPNVLGQGCPSSTQWCGTQSKERQV